MDDHTGLACALGSVLLFGTNYLPVKQYDVGDGFFFQWCLCIGIWLVGVCIDLLHPKPPPFEPLAILGGIIWCTGQLAVVPIVQTIGIAKGLIIWGSTAMLAGWACGVFGLLGVSSQAAAVHSWALNVAGLVLCLASLAASILIRPSVSPGGGGGGGGGGGRLQQRWQRLRQRAAARVQPLEQKLLAGIEDVPSLEGAPAIAAAIGPEWLRRLSPPQRSAVGVGLALVAGLFFGTNFNPSQYVIDRAGTAAWPHASTHGIDYVHAQFSGIALASTVYFAVYCAATRNRPAVLPQVALPALASGIMWGVADALWFVANEKLGFVVAFPIVFAGPGIVASLWSIFLLRELEGARNYLLTAVVALLVIGGGTCISLSRV